VRPTPYLGQGHLVLEQGIDLGECVTAGQDAQHELDEQPVWAEQALFSADQHAFEGLQGMFGLVMYTQRRQRRKLGVDEFIREANFESHRYLQRCR
jgi:hypothetical protein